MIVLFAFTLPLAGCVDLANRPADLHLAALPTAPGHLPPGDWWLAAGDPVLAHLVAQGLSASVSLACEAAASRPATANAHRPRAGTAEAAYRFADHRARAAAAIAHAYVAVRQWQSLLALRTGVIDQYRDNTEIAHFRREAGLVSAIDGGVAGALSAQNNGALEQTSARLAARLAALAQLVGLAPDELTRQLAPGMAVPDLGPSPPPPAAGPDLSARADLLALQIRLERRLQQARITQAGIDQAMADPTAAPPASLARNAVTAWRRARAIAEAEIRVSAAALAAADARIETLSGHEPLAQRAVADARLAYRAGAGDFATLFVTEVAALGGQEALVEARADRAAAIIDLRTASGEGRSPADLAPAALSAAAARQGADCD